MRRRYRLRRAAAALAIVAVLWLGGFIWFLSLVPDRVRDPDSVTDAIVVLTGGSQRLDTGLRLLGAAKAKTLFVTGVHPGVATADLLRQSSEPGHRVPCCIILGHTAESTFGNALETASFMREKGFHSLRLVTASYHMPRSLVEFRRAMPQVRIVPNPVFPALMRGGRWWQKPASVALLAEEYVKYLVALARPPMPAAP